MLSTDPNMIARNAHINEVRHSLYARARAADRVTVDQYEANVNARLARTAKQCRDYNALLNSLDPS